MSNVGGFEAYEIAVIGAGAAGLAAALAAGEVTTMGPPPRVVLLNGARTIGAKILVSGGGRCNVTHETVTSADYFGNRRIIKNALASFPVDATMRWFASLGVALKREPPGKLFPVTDRAHTVLTALLTRCRSLGIVLRPDHRVTAIEPTNQATFLITHRHGSLLARKVIVATGGRSLPRTGSDGFGYELARRLGHRVTETAPALVPLVLDDSMFHRSLAGLSHTVELTTRVNGHLVDRRTGSLLWTHFGISGPVVMDASRFWCLAQTRKEAADIKGNFFPGRNHEQVRAWLIEEGHTHPRRSLANTLSRRLPDRFVEAMLRHTGIDGAIAIAQLPRKERDRLMTLLTAFPFPVVGHRGWNHAEVTAGGVLLEEIDYRTMESKIAPGLYFAGEILDCDGRLGGFNFQWAWTTGRLAGQAAAASLAGQHPPSVKWSRQDHSQETERGAPSPPAKPTGRAVPTRHTAIESADHEGHHQEAGPTAQRRTIEQREGIGTKAGPQGAECDWQRQENTH
ncbi:putative Oxidoreductase with FAD/NAD(P)-binding domain [Candidatus Nitrospira inopinata]|uniref:Putative Oxidoreductase with FAD/NAD(P)-binding domain n=1 Tax=Candidatus Nitrospira inopinata TaxID=1715989 RepID=A0A0S4KVJ0_9BACT|nr:putative Oxidoreductase with FAD/NAD(P)-binding domain [Candidatus Nitrospira inopinata]